MSNDDDTETIIETWSRRVLEEARQSKREDARAKPCWTKGLVNRSTEEETWCKVRVDGDGRRHLFVCYRVHLVPRVERELNVDEHGKTVA